MVKKPEKVVDKNGKCLYNFIVQKRKKLNRYIHISLSKGGIENGTTKKKMVKSKNTF